MHCIAKLEHQPPRYLSDFTAWSQAFVSHQDHVEATLTGPRRQSEVTESCALYPGEIFQPAAPDWPCQTGNASCPTVGRNVHDFSAPNYSEGNFESVLRQNRKRQISDRQIFRKENPTPLNFRDCKRRLAVDTGNDVKALRGVKLNTLQRAWCPSILQVSVGTPVSMQRGKYNFRNLSSCLRSAPAQDVASLQCHIRRSLCRHGLCVINHFMGSKWGVQIAQEVRTLHKAQVWVKGQSLGEYSTGKRVREDVVTWVGGTELDHAGLNTLCAKLDDVVSSGAGVTDGYDICGSTKAMVARYAGQGAGYQLHVDNPGKDGRCLTCIYYLNKNWNNEAMGGNLRLYAKTSGKTADIQPSFDRVVFFYSDARNPHEVLPAFEDRYAITLWYFDRGERTRAIEKMG